MLVRVTSLKLFVSTLGVLAAAAVLAGEALELLPSKAIWFSPDGKAVATAGADGVAMYREGAWQRVSHPVKGNPASLYVFNSAPRAGMPEPGIYRRLGWGQQWRRVAAQRLEGVVRALAAHPREPKTVAAGTADGLFLSFDAGERFTLLDGKGPVSAVAFDRGGRRLHYVRADATALHIVALDGSPRSMVPLPPIGIDFVESIAQSPVDEDAFAIATFLNKVFLTANGGSSWRQIAGRTQ